MSELFDWLEEKARAPRPEHRDSAEIWDAARLDMPAPPAIDEAWADLRVRLAEADLQATPRATAWSWLLGSGMARFALVLVLCLAVGYVARDWMRPAFAAERGVSRKAVTLADTSMVTMNADSRLTLSHGFNKKDRRVFLNGEAYFEVEKAEKPFIITAGGATVQVIGTKFNLYARDGRVRLDVTEGIVALSTMADGTLKTVRVHAGESSMVEDGKAPEAPRANDLKQEQPLWLKDLVEFDNTPFKEACSVLERRFDITIHIEDPTLVKTPVNGTFETKDLETAMTALVDTVGCSFRRVSDGVYMMVP